MAGLRWNRCGWVVLALVVSLAPGVAMAKEKAKKPKAPAAKAEKAPQVKATVVNPWALRDQWEFQFGSAALVIGVGSAEWRIASQNPKLDMVLDDVGFRIVFADGTSWEGTSLGKAESGREPYKDEIGEGMVVWMQFPPKDGLIVRVSAIKYKERPFFIIKYGIGNDGSKPVEIARIVPAVLGPTGVRNLGPDTQYSLRHIEDRGGFPVFTGTGPSTLATFYDPANDFLMALGVIPRGIATSTVDIRPDASAWQGDITSKFDPPVRIDPGQKFESDPLWISVGMADPARVDNNYSWAWNLLRHPSIKDGIPRAWSVADKAANENEVYDAAKAWLGAHVNAALVPNTWEGHPGSFEGAAPNFPKNMGKMAEKLDKLGVKPGLAVDPMLAAGPGAEASSDGFKWANLASAEGMKAAVDHLKKKVAACGFSFYVVVPSQVPDEALKKMNMTRGQANSLAIAAMAQAAPDKPVMPAPGTDMEANLDQWLAAAADSARMAYFGVVPGPVRLDASKVTALDAPVLAAMSLFKGPIVCSGTPAKNVEGQLASLVDRPAMPGLPLDMAKPSPKVWQVAFNDGACGASLIMFPGAPAWKLSQLDKSDTLEARAWNPANGKLLEGDSLPAADKLTVYGLMPAAPHPALMGASLGLTLLLDEVSKLAWDDAKATLSGTFRGGNREAATAYVNVPQGWTFKSGKAGNAAVKAAVAGAEAGAEAGRVTFKVEPGVATAFSLQFSK